MDNNIFINNHPLVQHKITRLRDKSTGTNEFRSLVGEIAMLMGYGERRISALVQITFAFLLKKEAKKSCWMQSSWQHKQLGSNN